MHEALTEDSLNCPDGAQTDRLARILNSKSLFVLPSLDIAIILPFNALIYLYHLQAKMLLFKKIII